MDIKYKKLEIEVRKKISWDFLGSFNSAFKWNWVEFESLREYVYWDSIKSIDWKSTAKTGTVFVKNYVEEKDLKILFIIEKTDSLNFWSERTTKKDTLKELFLLLWLSSIMNWYSISIFMNNKISEFKKSKQNIFETLYDIDNDEYISNDLVKINIKNTLIFNISDSLEPNFSRFKYLNIKNEIVFINIFDYFENNLSEDKFDIDVLWSKVFNLFLWKELKIDKYKKSRQNLIDDLKKSLKKNNIEYLSLDNRVNLYLELYKFFNKYKI